MRSRSNSMDFYVQKILKYKRSAIKSSSPLVDAEDNRIFDELLIFGHNPLPQTSELRGKRKNSIDTGPSLLTMFPSSVHSRTLSEYQHISHFCFPNGFKTVKRSNKLEIISAFPFLLSSSRNAKTRCFCIQFIAPSVHSPFFSTNYSRKYPFAICILYKSCLLGPIADFLTFLLHLICGEAVPNKLPDYESNVSGITGFCVEGLKYDQNFPSVAVAPNIKATRLFVEELHYFYSLPLHSRLREINLSLNFKLVIPTIQNEIDTLAYPSLNRLITLLSPDNIVKLYTAILLDYHVVIYSKDLSRAAICVVAAYTLLYPFEYNNSIIPIIPEAYKEILDLPTPYIAGTCFTTNSEVLVDLDHNCIYSYNIPKLPKGEELSHKLKLVIESSIINDFNQLVLPVIYSKIDPPKINPSPFLIDSVLSIFRNHLPPRISADLHPFFVTDRSENIPITVLNTELFLDAVNEEDKPFYTQFSTTQAFDDFVSNITDNYSKTCGSPLSYGRFFFSD